MSELTCCPKCGGKMVVVDTDPLTKSLVRVRRCKDCRYCVATEETVTAIVSQGQAAAQPRA